VAEPLLADTHMLLWYFEGMRELAPPGAAGWMSR